VSSVGFALQKAIYSALDAALSVSVYDDVPEGAAYPYVTLSGEEVADASALNSERTRRVVYLTVWSAYAGQREVKNIIGDIRAALHNRRLALDVGRLAMLYVAGESVTPDPDGRSYMGRVTLQAMVTHGA